MANLVIITGPLAVGKMTVAEAIKEIRCCAEGQLNEQGDSFNTYEYTF